MTSVTNAVTGTDVLREIVRVRSKTPGTLALIARDISVGVGALENFGNRRGDLPVAALKLLAQYVLPFSEYDPEIDRLRSTNRAEPISIGVGITPAEARERYIAHLETQLAKARSTPVPVPAPVTPPKPREPRPGWA